MYSKPTVEVGSQLRLHSPRWSWVISSEIVLVAAERDMVR